MEINRKVQDINFYLALHPDEHHYIIIHKSELLLYTNNGIDKSLKSYADRENIIKIMKETTVSYQSNRVNYLNSATTNEFAENLTKKLDVGYILRIFVI